MHSFGQMILLFWPSVAGVVVAALHIFQARSWVQKKRFESNDAKIVVDFNFSFCSINSSQWHAILSLCQWCDWSHGYEPLAYSLGCYLGCRDNYKPGRRMKEYFFRAIPWFISLLWHTIINIRNNVAWLARKSSYIHTGDTLRQSLSFVQYISHQSIKVWPA